MSFLEQEDYLVTNAVTHENHISLSVAEKCSLSELPSEIIIEEKRILRKTNIQLQANQPLVITKIIAHTQGLDHNDAPFEAKSICAQAFQKGYSSLLEEHNRQWQHRPCGGLARRQ